MFRKIIFCALVIAHAAVIKGAAEPRSAILEDDIQKHEALMQNLKLYTRAGDRCTVNRIRHNMKELFYVAHPRGYLSETIAEIRAAAREREGLAQN